MIERNSARVRLVIELTARQPATPTMPKPAATPRQVLLIVCAGVVLASLDLFIVNVALPQMARDLNAPNLAELSWVLNGYAIVYASLLVFFGRLADRYRRDRGFLLGVAIFTAASAACAASTSVGMLIAFRLVQATGAALLTPTSLGLLLASYEPEAPFRRRAGVDSGRGPISRPWAGGRRFACGRRLALGLFSQLARRGRRPSRRMAAASGGPRSPNTAPGPRRRRFSYCRDRRPHLWPREGERLGLGFCAYRSLPVWRRTTHRIVRAALPYEPPARSCSRRCSVPASSVEPRS